MLLQNLLGLGSRTCTFATFQWSRSKSPDQSKFKEWENRPHPPIAGAAKHRGHAFQWQIARLHFSPSTHIGSYCHCWDPTSLHQPLLPMWMGDRNIFYIGAWELRDLALAPGWHLKSWDIITYLWWIINEIDTLVVIATYASMHRYTEETYMHGNYIITWLLRWYRVSPRHGTSFLQRQVNTEQ